MVCDDVKLDRDILVKGIKEVWQDVSVEETSGAGETLEKLEQFSDYDFIFLDIYMDGMNGIELGRKIRENYSEIKLVFISDSRDFGPEAFELQAVHYLLKPYRKELLEEIRDRYSGVTEATIRIYDSAVKQEKEILCSQIAYIESAHNYVYIHLVSSVELKVRISMQSLEENLDERFLRINRGVIVNMDIVEKMNSDSCEIEGMTFLLSRGQRLECRRKYNEYIFRHYMEGAWGGV